MNLQCLCRQVIRPVCACVCVFPDKVGLIQQHPPKPFLSLSPSLSSLLLALVNCKHFETRIHKENKNNTPWNMAVLPRPGCDHGSIAQTWLWSCHVQQNLLVAICTLQFTHKDWHSSRTNFRHFCFICKVYLTTLQTQEFLRNSEFHGLRTDHQAFMDKRLMIGPEPWNSELHKNSCVCYVVTRSTSPPGKYWAPSPAFIHWKSLKFTSHSCCTTGHSVSFFFWIVFRLTRKSLSCDLFISLGQRQHGSAPQPYTNCFASKPRTPRLDWQLETQNLVGEKN